MTFYNRIFVVFVFDEISKGMLVTVEKEPGKYFNITFLKSVGLLIKMHCRVRYLFDFDLRIRSDQVEWVSPVKVEIFLEQREVVFFSPRKNKNYFYFRNPSQN